jgi:hypothetical protein
MFLRSYHLCADTNEYDESEEGDNDGDDAGHIGAEEIPNPGEAIGDVLSDAIHRGSGVLAERIEGNGTEGS